MFIFCKQCFETEESFGKFHLNAKTVPLLSDCIQYIHGLDFKTALFENRSSAVVITAKLDRIFSLVNSMTHHYLIPHSLFPRAFSIIFIPRRRLSNLLSVQCPRHLRTAHLQARMWRLCSHRGQRKNRHCLKLYNH